MIKNKFVALLLIAVLGTFVACNSTKPATSTEEKVDNKPNKKDNTVYDLLGNSDKAASTGIKFSSKFVDANNGQFKVTVSGGPQQIGNITYFLLDREEEITYMTDSIAVKYIKDNFSLEYQMNGERQLSYEIGPLNDKQITYSRNENGIWEVSNGRADGLAYETLKDKEKSIARYHDGEGLKLRKPFYPTAIKVGQSWTLLNDDLRWILDGTSSSYNASGQMTLKEVVVEEDDSVAVIDFNFAIDYISYFDEATPPLKKQLAFKGEVKRSLKNFIDNSMDLDGAYTIQRVIPAQGNEPKLDIDIQAVGKLTITEELLE